MFYILPIFCCVVLISIDQIIKYYTIITFTDIDNIEIIENFFYITHTNNPGAAWGVLSGARIFFIVITIIAVIIMAVYYVKLPKCNGSGITRTAIVLISSGAIGNFIDRLFRDGGKVVDMFHCTFWGFYDFPVFNFADILIVTGTILFAIAALFFPDIDLFSKKNNKKNKKEK